MNKPEKITSIESPKDVERVDNSFNILFQQAQAKEFTFLTFSGAGVWPAAGLIPEKQCVICENTTDNAERLYTKIKGNLKYIAWT